jgi:gamma-glutamylcyclotransferase (GGCT)/AIG2-like uncharacterized protein YtfP
MNQFLFVYGTLHPDRAPNEIKCIVERMVPLAQGAVAGTLHNLGEYPGLTLSETKQQVRGTIFVLPDDPAVLAQLDHYESCLPNDPANSLFISSGLPTHSTPMAGSPSASPTINPPSAKPTSPTGNLYLCAAALLPLGTDPFWSASHKPWTSQKAWSGIDIPADHAISN